MVYQVKIVRARGDVVLSEWVTYELADGSPVRFEVETPAGFQQAGGAGKVAGRVSEAAGSVLRAAAEVLEQAKALSPDEVELSFALKVTGEAGWAIAKVGTEGSFALKLTWRPESAESSESTQARKGEMADE